MPHQIRQTFDPRRKKLIDNLKSDPDMAQKADNIKAWLKMMRPLTTILAKYAATCGAG